ncbi:MAG: glycosyltransferase [Candidatus Woesearchaeota archaeon]|nr:MAG: glycosyltransferase [Candidatus Woesearchaeota archaeon]
MKMEITLVLPAYNEEEHIEKSFLNIKEGVSQFPEYNFNLFVIDDSSTDKTWDKILKYRDEYKLNMFCLPNKQNIGLDPTLKRGYEIVLGTNTKAIIKTDLDSDFNQKIVLEKLVPYIKTDKNIAVGVRCREISKKENPYEFKRKQEILRILREEFNITDFDPPSLGSQFYKRGFLEDILTHPMVKNHKKNGVLIY